MALEVTDIISSSGAVPIQWGDHTIINTQHGSIIDWSNFNTNVDQSVTFNQYMGALPDSASAVLNRISSGAVPTMFNGVLNANGRVFVVNPAGIIFGAGSSINVNQLVASGLNMSNDAFQSVLEDEGNPMIFGGGAGQVENYGSIGADSVHLIGRRIVNMGTIAAPDGLVVMAAGDEVYLAQDGSNVVVELNAESVGSGAVVQNRNVVSTDNGKIVLAAGDSFSGAIINTGILAASAGEVTIDAARVENSGLMTTDATDRHGGHINIAATEEVVLQPGSRTTANAGLNGSGGNVILKSEGTTVVSEGAVVEARGGEESGDGGFVEVSGEHFVLAGNIDTSAQNGKPGTVFIDPLDVTIASGANAGAVDTVYEDDIQDDSQAGMNVIVEAENSIIVEDIPDDEITGGAGDIHLRTTGADSSILFVDKEDSITTTLGDIVLEAGGGGINIGSLMTGSGMEGQRVTPGRITVTTLNDGDIVAKDMFIQGGAGITEIHVDASGNLTIEGDVSIGTASAAILDIPGGPQALALVHLIADDHVILDGDIVEAHANTTERHSGGERTWAYIMIQAGADGTANRDVTIGADLTSHARDVRHAGIRAYIDISATDDVIFEPDAAAPVAIANCAAVQGYTNEAYYHSSGKTAKIIINNDYVGPDPSPEPDPDPDPDPDPPVIPLYEPAPVQKEVLETAGCPALMAWTANELGIDERMMQIWTANALASTQDIQPCDTCAKLRAVATVLQDAEGTHTAALAEVIGEFASRTDPPSPEEMTLIASAISDSSDDDSHYARARVYLDALSEYIGTLNNELNFSTEESILFAADRYIAPLAEESQNDAMVAFIAARLAAFEG